MTQALLEAELPGLKRLSRGKVRDIFEAPDGLLLVATDRFSAFDVILSPGIPGRGVVLTELSAFWFERLAGLCPHHMLSMDPADMPPVVQERAQDYRGRTMLARRLEIVPVECVVRGYLAGSGWSEYQRSRSVCGVGLPAGLVESDRLAEPIFTPTTKAHEGHDEPLTFEQVAERVGGDLAVRLRDLSLQIYATAADYASEHGIILADTKFEFGLHDGVLHLADEALTPDSSRYWDTETYEPGRSQDSFDKQIARDWLEQTGWNKRPPPPDLDPAIIERYAAGTRRSPAG